MSRFWILYALTGLSFVGPLLRGPYSYLTVLVAWLIIPILDHLINRTVGRPSDVDEAHTLRYDLVLWLFVPLQLSLILWGAYFYTTQTLALYEKIGLFTSVGVVTGGLGITIAHELVHRRSRFEKTLGEMLLVMVCYPHFAVEHTLGHHANVGTSRDPATSRKGESFYAFFLRSVCMGYVSAWALEAQRLRRKGKSPLTLNNNMIWYHLWIVLWFMGVTSLFGSQAIWFLTGQSFVAIAELEAVNFVEHYGLTRREIAPGKYEKVSEMHSWDCNRWLSNSILVNLQLHADHHAHATRPYQKLRSMPLSPKLPFGYPTMIMVSLFPPLWRRLMDPKLTAWIEKNSEKPMLLEG